MRTTRSSRPDAAAFPENPSGAPSTRFRSILWEQPDGVIGADGSHEPDFFVDLNLDQVVASVVAGREQYDLEPLFYAPLHDVEDVHYRHEVLRDLEKPDVLEPVTEFAAAMRCMREHLAQAEKLHYPLQKQKWFLDAIAIYCEAVRALPVELAERDMSSRGLQRLCDYLTGYTGSEGFTSLALETRELKDALADVRYAVRINGARVTVSRFEGEPDYSADVEATFARFKQGKAKSYLVNLPDATEMNHVEAQVLDRVARLHPEVFRPLADYCLRHGDHLDATVARFDREVQFYVAYLELVERLRSAGLAFCYPGVSARSKEIDAKDSFDLALAIKLASAGGSVVCNEFHLDEPERIFVVSGPNNGGKTTFARSVGQMHYLAGLGLLVPGSEAQLFLPDRIFTHFEREEDLGTLRGKFEDELVRVHAILEHATSSSLIVMNESFNSTSLNDALFVGTEVMRRILALSSLGVYVTFVEEIAVLSDATVSMVAQIVPENPAERTFKVLRKPADGLAYAWAIAEKYGLTYERLTERIGA